MNEEVVKAMNKPEETKIHKWWRTHKLTIGRIVLFPIYLSELAYDSIKHSLYNKVSWDEQRALDILAYYIPRASEWDKENECFYYFNNGCGWNLCFAKKYLKRKDRRFWKKYDYEIRDLLINKFELEGFTKDVGDCSEGWTEVTFYIEEWVK